MDNFLFKRKKDNKDQDKKARDFDLNIAKSRKKSHEDYEDKYLHILQKHFVNRRENSSSKTSDYSDLPESTPIENEEILSTSYPEKSEPKTTDKPSPGIPPENKSIPVIPETVPPETQETKSAPEEIAEKEPLQQKTTEFERGDIFYLEDKTIVVFNIDVPDKEYDFVYVLHPSGKIIPQGICLYAYERMKIGHIPESYLERFDNSIYWDRDLILYHLDELGFSYLLPRPGPSIEKPKKDSVERSKKQGKKLTRGKIITIEIGKNKWEAVYWGKDSLGTVLAHNTNGKWSLMHLDLERFKGNVKYGKMTPQDKMDEIEKQIAINEG